MIYRKNAKPECVRCVDWGSVGARALLLAPFAVVFLWVVWSWRVVLDPTSWEWSEEERCTWFVGPAFALGGFLASCVVGVVATVTYVPDLVSALQRASKRPLLKERGK